MSLVFVYGSLRRGATNHRVLEGATLVRQAISAPRYTLYDLGDYPALIEPGTTAITGELYLLPAWLLREVDAFEGHPLLFERRAVALAGDADAEAYFFRDPIPARAVTIPGGDYLAAR